LAEKAAAARAKEAPPPAKASPERAGGDSNRAKQLERQEAEALGEVKKYARGGMVHGMESSPLQQASMAKWMRKHHKDKEGVGDRRADMKVNDDKVKGYAEGGVVLRKADEIENLPHERLPQSAAERTVSKAQREVVDNATQRMREALLAVEDHREVSRIGFEARDRVAGIKERRDAAEAVTRAVAGGKNTGPESNALREASDAKWARKYANGGLVRAEKKIVTRRPDGTEYVEADERRAAAEAAMKTTVRKERGAVLRRAAAESQADDERARRFEDEQGLHPNLRTTVHMERI
jgi:hypothetical protein